MQQKDMVDLKREKLRNLLQQEMDGYQYEIYSSNGSQYLLDKFTSFNNFNNKNRTNENTNIINEQNIDFNNQINNQYLYNQNEQNFFMKNNDKQQYEQSNQMNNYENGNNFYQNNNNGNINYGNLDLDAQINNYNAHYNKLRVDEFMSKKIIQDDLLNKINQKLMKINKDINDKVYQEQLAEQWANNQKNQNK